MTDTNREYVTQNGEDRFDGHEAAVVAVLHEFVLEKRSSRKQRINTLRASLESVLSHVTFSFAKGGYLSSKKHRTAFLSAYGDRIYERYREMWRAAGGADQRGAKPPKRDVGSEKKTGHLSPLDKNVRAIRAKITRHESAIRELRAQLLEFEQQQKNRPVVEKLPYKLALPRQNYGDET